MGGFQIIVGMVISALSAIVELALVAVIGFTQPQCWDDRMFGTTPKSLSLEKICSPVYAGYVGAFVSVSCKVYCYRVYLRVAC